LIVSQQETPQRKKKETFFFFCWVAIVNLRYVQSIIVCATVSETGYEKSLKTSDLGLEVWLKW
jgi:hypothetical protein